MITIEINNQYGQLSGHRKTLNKLYEALKVRHPNAFYLRRFMRPGWDGKIEYISDQGRFRTGMTQRIIELVESYGVKYQIVDSRLGSLKPKYVGSFKSITLRDYQEGSVKAIIENRIKDSKGHVTPLYRGVLKEATNSGKTLIAVALHYSFRKAPTIMVINNTELYEQALRELPELLDCPLGRVDPKKFNLTDFTIAKVKTLSNRMSDPKLRSQLSKFQVCIVDECDLSDNATYKSALKYLIYSTALIGMSGTVNVGKLAKHKVKAFNIESIFGKQLHETRNIDLIKKGHSSEVIIKIVKGNEKTINGLTFDEEYTLLVADNKDRNLKIIKRLKYNVVRRKRVPALVIGQRLKHVKNIYRLAKKHLPDTLVIKWLTGQSPSEERKRVTQEFIEGKVDILISSMIFQRGMNFKKMQYLLNAAGGESPERPLQILGRQFRKAEGIKTKYFEDFYDEGLYLRNHSKKREAYYFNEGIPVLRLF